MGLFGKKKTPSEILAEGRALYERGEYGKAAMTLLKATGKENGEIDYWIGRSYLAMDEKKGKAPSWTAKQYLQTAAENGYAAAAVLLEEKFGTKDLSKNTPASVEEPAPVAAPVPESKSAAVDEKPAPESQSSETKTEAVPETEEERYEKGMELFRAGKYDEAFPLLKRVCPLIGIRKKKYPVGQATMGWMYEQGYGTEADASIAELHYKIAAQNGNQEGMRGYVRLVSKGGAPASDACQTALDYARQMNDEEAVAALEHRLVEARVREIAEAEQKQAEQYDQLFQEGVAAHKAGDYSRALELFEKVAEYGDSAARYNCGMMYSKGEGTETDKKKALYWYEKAAEQGDAIAQYNCGMMYSKGEGTETDKKKALYWFEKAAEQGNVNAQFNCGVSYSEGEGTETNLKKALYWFEKAAEQGNPLAQFNCIMMDGKGGTERDSKKALYWLEKAAEQGYEEARAMLAKLKEAH